MSALEEDLELFLADEDQAPVEELVVEPPADAEAADFMLRRLARRFKLIDEAHAAAERVIERTRHWEHETTAGLRREAVQIQEALRQYHQALLAKEPKRTSVSLPAGTLKSKQNPDKVEVVDTNAFVAWALEEQPALLKHEPRKSLIKQTLRVNGSALVDPTTGEKVPGLVAVAGERSFWVAFHTDPTTESEVQR